jgi:hypothetical protein
LFILLFAVWKRYFTENNGPGVALYEVDYGPDPKQTACVDDFLKEHPNVCDGIFLVRNPD